MKIENQSFVTVNEIFDSKFGTGYDGVFALTTRNILANLNPLNNMIEQNLIREMVVGFWFNRSIFTPRKISE